MIQPAPDGAPTLSPALPLLAAHVPELTAAERARLLAVGQGLLAWNERVNLVSRADAANLEERHLLHCALPLRFFRFAPGAHVLDLGTGGGLPGLVLAATHPEAQFTLLDSTQKKLRAVEAIAQEAGLANVRVLWARAEDYAAGPGHSAYDYVTGRAVTRLAAFWALARPLLRCRAGAGPWPGGVLYLKGGALAEELAELPRGLTTAVHPLAPLAPALPFFETKQLVYISACR